MFRCFCFGLSFFFLSFFFLTNKELPFCSVGEPPRAYICMTLPHFPDPSLFESQKVVTLPPPPPLGSDKSLNLMPFPWNFRRQTLYRDRSVLNTNSKIYFRKTTGRLLTVKKQCKRISWQEHFPNRADTTRLRSEAKHMFSYLDFRCYFEANGPRSHPFSVKDIFTFEIYR